MDPELVIAYCSLHYSFDRLGTNLPAPLMISRANLFLRAQHLFLPRKGEVDLWSTWSQNRSSNTTIGSNPLHRRGHYRVHLDI